MFFFLLLLLVAGCSAPEPEDAACIACHRGLEPASAAHPGCTPCHGGDGAASDKAVAHRGMLGPKNPSGPRFWEKSCGRCHPSHLGRVQGNLMTTNAGMIRNIRATWEGGTKGDFAAAPADLFDAKGEPRKLEGVASLDNLSGELYRKFCSLCHVGRESTGVYAGSHGGGCAACHFPYNDTATYEGGDTALQGQWPHSASHALSPLPENRVCFRCHNRSGRIALSYEGRYDGNNSLVPTRDGLPGPEIISGVRNVTRIAPDIHHAKGMECIDCHTSRDVMGDGYAYDNMYQQTEIACEDCHGSADEAPRSEPVVRENDAVLRESRSYPTPMDPGAEMILTAKGRKYSNAFFADGKVWVEGKRSGRLHESKVITGTPEHTIAGHGRMECYSCHSRTVVQCYGCHTRYDQGKESMDYIAGRMTPGAFSESEDYRMLYPFPLALNQRGRVSTVTPGCQTFVTVVDGEGRKVKSEYVSRYKGSSQLRFAPFFGHNTGPKAIGCSECHGNPAFLGFGQHVVAGGDIEGTLLCERSGSKPLDGFLTLRNGRVRAFSAITREDSRALSGAEVKRVLAVNQCLVCHDDPKDPIYQNELDYAILDTCLARPLSRP